MGAENPVTTTGLVFAFSWLAIEPGHMAARAPEAQALRQLHADQTGFDFICGDEVYGGCTQLREFFEVRGQAYVLRVASKFMVTLAKARPGPVPGPAPHRDHP